MRNFLHPPPAPPGFGQGKVLPELKASPFSRLFFSWLNPFLSVGYSRPLEKDDLWDLPEHRRTTELTDRMEQAFYTRVEPDKRPPHLQAQLPEAPVYDASVWGALYQVFKLRWLYAGFFMVIAATLQTTTPLVSKLLFEWLASSYVFHRLSDEERQAAQQMGFNAPKGIGYGIGLAFGLFVMQEAASLFNNHGTLTTMANGLYVRTGIIGTIFRKSLRLSGRARLDHSVGQITTMISTDATRLDHFSALGNHIWIAPIQIIICIALLIHNMGVSALVGLGVLVFSFPFQSIFIVIILNQRKKGVKITDSRIRLTTEVLQGIRLLKLFTWETFYLHQITALRVREIETVKKIMIANAGLMAMFTFAPVLAATLSFVTYSLTNHELTVATVFSSLQFFNIIQMPLILLPVSLSAFADASVAVKRISAFLTSEELGAKALPSSDASNSDTRSDSKSLLDDGGAEHGFGVEGDGVAISVDASFTWETAGKIEGKFDPAQDKEKDVEDDPKVKAAKAKEEKDRKKAEVAAAKKAKKDAKAKAKGSGGEDVLPVHRDDTDVKAHADGAEGDEDEKAGSAKEEEKPFVLENFVFSVKRGSFVAIVGRVGSGKSSVLQGIIGEMRRTSGKVMINGQVAYVPQNPWIRNMTLRDNILFGSPYDQDRFQETVKACCLEPDIATLPHGIETEIGEKGINLSGGQKARVSLARAVYSQAQIILMDDPLSAVDAYVGKSILDNCLLTGPLATRTRVLVTHSLGLLEKTDMVYVMDGGMVREEGTYQDLMHRQSLFSRLIEEYGSLDSSTTATARPDRKEVISAEKADAVDPKAQANLMQEEERETGAVSWNVYARYLQHAGGLVWFPINAGLLILTQSITVGTNIFLGIWTSGSIPGFTQSQYIAVYVGLGAAQTVSVFFSTWAFFFMCLRAGLSLFRGALAGVLGSPLSMFDTTPMGRIISRLSKDQDTLDTQLSSTMFSFLFTTATVFGTVFLVFYTFPLLGIIFAPLIVLYYVSMTYYRKSSVEVKRLDSLTRSQLYASYSETLTGLSTIRAYNMQASSITTAEKGLDMENKAYYMTVAIQRWLAIRLDLFGNFLILGIGLFAAGYRYSVDPSKIGVVLTYALSITQILSEMISQFAQNEQNMNAVERVLVYTDLAAEGARTTENDPPAEWPQHGAIEFDDVELAYREGLPLVLRGVSFSVNKGEKIGVVGRTGAGKSSLLQALFRAVEVRQGTITIDGVDISKIGLDTLRQRLALVPQDTTLFLGTLRENIDPMKTRTDAELISVLQRCWLLSDPAATGETKDPAAEAKFDLDATVGDEGSNYSAGEKQLLALARALVKNSRIIVLDEATSSVDVETDAKVQRTIQTQFSSSTLICIAHRLNTIAYYDRVLVMDAGTVAEFDTVLNLFDNEASIFRSLCEEAGLSRADILRIRSQNQLHAAEDHS